ncbi:retropepsin-like aspartic protease [Sphingobacterium psychroaquaticum]|uniref:Aspartyl protease n=1 Tax=Sphingobacterium psychroaquaticum TaxID=561061 RepID=A0A1X7KRS5_9SPHI|nr:retropepsin-like aspartic protease [Sphingobacterium psychroaquaticum]SMG43912.1 Aspartyl protease [Sphingobacterium psychroaquaticum]
MQKIPLEILNLQGDGYHILVRVELFGQVHKMVVDTGASKTVLDKTMLLNIGIQEEEMLHTDILSTGLGTNSMQSYSIIIPELRIMHWQTKKFNAAILDLSAINYAYEQMEFPPVIGILGGDILRRFAAKINYKELTLTLNQRGLKLE